MGWERCQCYGCTVPGGARAQKQPAAATCQLACGGSDDGSRGGKRRFNRRHRQRAGQPPCGTARAAATARGAGVCESCGAQERMAGIGSCYAQCCRQPGTAAISAHCAEIASTNHGRWYVKYCCCCCSRRRRRRCFRRGYFFSATAATAIIATTGTIASVAATAASGDRHTTSGGLAERRARREASSRSSPGRRRFGGGTASDRRNGRGAVCR